MSDGVQLNASSAMSSRSRDTAMTGRHDGHSDGHLNCVAMRHGWSRNFSLAPSEVTYMSYETLTRALEFHTLNLRPMMHRVFVEHPPASGTWCKIRPFKNDGSLQTVLVRAFFDGRLNDGVVTVLDIRDGADRREEGDGLSLKSVSSRIFHAKDKEDKKPGGWFSKLLKRVSPKSKPVSNPDASESHTQLRELDEDDVDDHSQSNHQEAQKKPAPTSIFQTGLFSYFMSPPPPPPRETKPSPEVQEEQMRKRGWRPPGLRNRKPKEKNPFLSGHERDDPFNDPTAVAEHDDDGESRDIDEFFQMERPDGEVPMNNVNGNHKDKAWSRFTRNKSSKSKGKGKGKEREQQPEEKKERPMNKDQDWTPPAGSINSDVE